MMHDEALDHANVLWKQLISGVSSLDDKLDAEGRNTKEKTAMMMTVLTIIGIESIVKAKRLLFCSYVKPLLTFLSINPIMNHCYFI